MNETTTEYWTRFWKEHTKSLESKDPQSQVMRLDFSRNPISEKTWQGTLDHILTHIPLAEDDVVLDLCCGNGLITRAIAPRVKSVCAVDLSPQFIDRISQENFPNVEARASDMRELELPDNSLTKVILYSSLHYITPAEAVNLFVKLGRWLRKDGIAFIGDIPDAIHLWDYFNTPERKKAYFDAILAGRQIMGNWYSMDYLTHLATYAGFSEASVIAQPSHIPFHATRVDFLLKK